MTIPYDFDPEAHLHELIDELDLPELNRIAAHEAAVEGFKPRHTHRYDKDPVLTAEGVGFECECGQQIIAYKASKDMTFGNYGEGRGNDTAKITT